MSFCFEFEIQSVLFSSDLFDFLNVAFVVNALCLGCNDTKVLCYKQPYDKARNAVALALSPVVRALVDPDGAMQQIRDLDNV